MDFPICSPIEQSVQNQVNSLVGNNDINLNTIVKMSLMDEIKPIDEEIKQDIINKMKSNNAMEQYFVEKEYMLTYDICGNIILLNTIDEKGKNTENT
jgi:hypothetical protein